MALFPLLRGDCSGGRFRKIENGEAEMAKNGIAGAVEHLKYASRMQRKAFYDDPISSYIWRTPDAKGSWKGVVLKPLRDVLTSRFIKRYVREGRALTVLQGRALVLYTPPTDSLTLRDDPPSPSPPVNKNPLTRILFLCMTPQQRRRVDEVVKKHEIAIESVIGDRADKLFYVDLLCTHPKYQGQGFASILLNTVLEMADEAGRPTWLSSSNIKNTPFYESFGFKKVAEIVLGDDDPDWKGEPFISLLMMRTLITPKASWVSDEKVALLA
ncbi:hypothetical protein BV25DRAFT_1622480 [Artomyces pyxidatus]|uniref:Uncharacterized protein n=1 Tax=Artomyces pyxidatus TaxID=48021 RepID=A0ACB8TD47_9AGAM|nr:hypothetical protein BV25DRAFT_1622480 [Artomyces pyxidatus]